MENLLAFIVVGLLGFDVVCIIISLAIDYWIFYDSERGSLYAGLWEVCTEVKQGSQAAKVCADITDSKDHDAVRAMLFLGLFLVIGAIAAILVKLFVAKDKKIILYAAAGLQVVAGLFLLIGFSLYHADIFKDYEDNPFYPDINLHAGFAFCIISWLLTWGTAGLTGFVALRTE